MASGRAARDVAQLVEQNNHVEQLLTSIGYFLWTDGKLGAYVRYVADGQRFGFHDENGLKALEIPLGEDVYVCPQCGKETGKSKLANGNSEDADNSRVAGTARRSPVVDRNEKFDDRTSSTTH